jgi:hypothetical protein
MMVVSRLSPLFFSSAFHSECNRAANSTIATAYEGMGLIIA